MRADGHGPGPQRRSVAGRWGALTTDPAFALRSYGGQEPQKSRKEMLHGLDVGVPPPSNPHSDCHRRIGNICCLPLYPFPIKDIAAETHGRF